MSNAALRYQTTPVFPPTVFCAWYTGNRCQRYLSMGQKNFTPPGGELV
ncbi:hypothetical protein HMPREF0758_2789 [Serratia odorifera DSM 4582]|uniref:Uncharacterized protein n=1 Tax=Serratia odorifera DSM 4582 TaxID=667129 RepID=D4E3N9_SEROD|nr:hypothetical protein HMPREF0758_2789 [Serratia odorifera DSM 4582]